MVCAGRREWRREHIPGSAFADLLDLSHPDQPRRMLTMPLGATVLRTHRLIKGGPVLPAIARIGT